MKKPEEQKVSDAFNSMLRTDYISLDDIDKLDQLANYYVDYFGYLPQILAQSDQLLVGRRGTGKTTLVYRAFVECLRSWLVDGSDYTQPRTLGIYIDLSKCYSLENTAEGEFADFEHVFVTELCESITTQLHHFWPSLSKQRPLLKRIFQSAEHRKLTAIESDLNNLASLLRHGIPRLTKSDALSVEETQRTKDSDKNNATANLAVDKAGLSGESGTESEVEVTKKFSRTEHTSYRLSISDVLKILQSLRKKADIPAIFVFVDEFSALSTSLQSRFTTLLRRILGTHAGVFIKLCAITDYYTLGSSIILQRDLFEISLDLDAYVERNDSLNQAMAGLKDQAEEIVRSRLEAYQCPEVESLFENAAEIWEPLSLEAMGVPRTLGIVLQQAWNRRKPGTSRIRKSDIDYGIKYASDAYQNQLIGASKDGLAIPAHTTELWHALLERATKERNRERIRGAASHFQLLPQHEEALKYLNMFFLVHLLTKSVSSQKVGGAGILRPLSRGLTEREYAG